MTKPVAFLDRDGTLNKDSGYVHKISDFFWIPGAKKAIKYLKQKQYYVIVVTNQSGIARKMYNEDDVKTLHKYMNDELNKISAKIDDFYYSPYHPEVKNKLYNNLSNLRKPKTGMLKLAEKKWKFNKAKSFLIGDKKSDIDCAINYGIKGYQFMEPNLYEFIKKNIF